MLDPNKPVIGSDIEILRQKLGMSAQEMAWVLGIPSMDRWSQITKRQKDEPVSDINIAVMVRVLDEFPELNFMPKMPSPQEIKQTLEGQGYDISLKQFGILLGGESSAGYRWMQLGTRASPAVMRSCLLIKLLMEKKENGLEKWRRFINMEAVSRNIPDIWKTGRWKN